MAAGRRCDGCSKHYYRSNKMRQWVKRNPGSRAGWVKQEGDYCLDCQPVQISQRVMVVAQMIVKSHPHRRRRSSG